MVVFRSNLLKFDNKMNNGMIPLLSSYILKENTQRLVLPLQSKWNSGFGFKFLACLAYYSMYTPSAPFFLKAELPR